MTIYATFDGEQVSASPYHIVAHDGYAEAMQRAPFDDKAGKLMMDNAIAFYISQLAALDPKIYETKYRHIVYQDLVDVDMSGPSYMDTFEYIHYDAATMGKFIGANPKDIPNVALTANKSVIKVEEGGIGYTYTLQELEKSQAQNMPLDAHGAKAAERGFQEHAQSVCFLGDAQFGVTGLFNNANVSSDNSADTWDQLSQLERFNDMNSLLIKIWENSAQVHYASELLLPTQLATYLSQPMSAERPEITLGKYFAENNFMQSQGISVNVRMLAELNTAGAGSTSRMMAYEKTPENLTMKMPMPLEFLPPQPDGAAIEVPGRYKFGGVEFRYPTCAAYRDDQLA